MTTGNVRDGCVDFGFYIPKSAGYLVQKLERCANCRFVDGDPDGCHYCKLYVRFISIYPFDSKSCSFIMVDTNGKCRHYRKRKDEYRLGGVVNLNGCYLVFGESRKKYE